jgi:hypothetical protein
MKKREIKEVTLIKKIPNIIEYSAQFFTWKRMMKYFQRTTHGRQLKKGFRWLL